MKDRNERMSFDKRYSQKLSFPLIPDDFRSLA